MALRFCSAKFRIDRLIRRGRDSESIDPLTTPGRLPWVRLIALGILLRFAISAVSLGTNDATAWFRFGNEIDHWGLLQTYERDTFFNHPPIPGYWAMVAARLAGHGRSPLLFTNVFKLPMILADIGGMYLLWRIWRKRMGTRAMSVAAMFATSLNAILISAFHCNTEPVYIALCLLAVYLIEEHGWYFWAGTALGAAINIKAVPVLLIPVLVLSSRRKQHGARLLIGMLPWILPFLPALLLVRSHFIANVLHYHSYLDRWGINFLLLLGDPRFESRRAGSSDVLLAIGRLLVLALFILRYVTATSRGAWNRYELAATTFAMFLVFTPGFGMQYTALAGLMLFAVRPAIAVAYGSVAGAFACSAYVYWWEYSAPDMSSRPFAFPVLSSFHGFFPLLTSLLGLVAWGILVWFILRTLERPLGAKGVIVG